MSENLPTEQDEQKPNKGYSFMVGIFIGIAIIIIFTILFYH